MLSKNAADAALFDVNIPKCCDELGDYCSDSRHKDNLNAFSQAVVSALATDFNACSTVRQPPPLKFP